MKLRVQALRDKAPPTIEQIKNEITTTTTTPTQSITSVTFTSTPELGYTHTNSFDFTLEALPLSPLPHQVMASASQRPLQPQSSITVTIGGDSNKKQVLAGSPPFSTDTLMSDAGHQPEPEPAYPSTYNLADVVPDLSAFVSDMLGRNAGSSVASFPFSSELLIQLALAKKLENIHATILSIKAKADHAQQVPSSALNMASAATSASQTYAQMAATAPRNRPRVKAALLPRPPNPKPHTPPPLQLLLLPQVPPAPEARSLLYWQLLPPRWHPLHQPTLQRNADFSPP